MARPALLIVVWFRNPPNDSSFSDPPVIINNQSVVSITRAENKTLNFEVQGNPRPNFIWINESSGYVLSNESVLELINAKDSDTGGYSCNVTSPLGSDSYTILIRVTSKFDLHHVFWAQITLTYQDKFTRISQIIDCNNR